jgi:ER-derived vesicles protein
MSSCSTLAIMKKHTEIAVGGLFAVVVSQSIGYGLIFDSSFFFRTLSIIGGLVMLLAESSLTSNKRSIAGLPSLTSSKSSAEMLQLAGRVLLVCLFIGFVFAGEFTFTRTVVAIIALIGCIMVVIGFKAKWSAWMLITFLSISNVVLNNWWSLHQ